LIYQPFPKPFLRIDACNEQGLEDVSCWHSLWVKKTSRSEFPLKLIYLSTRLGFDTASEVALMALAVLSAHNGFPAALVILLPVLFAAAMCLVIGTSRIEAFR